jgi:hypothetical protein
MEWIDVAQKKPDTDQVCYVQNIKNSMDCFICVYMKDWDVFRLFDTKTHDNFAIEVTHWIPLPSPLNLR